MLIKWLAIAFLIPSFSWAESNTSSKGEINLESRFFNDDDIKTTQDAGYGISARIEVENTWNNLTTRAQVFSRTDRTDSTRQRLNIEELYAQYLLDNWAFFTGFRTLNWSTAEAFHPTDIINSRNFDGPFENAEKLGELMAGFQFFSEYLNLTAFYMPTLNRPQLPTQTNRLSFAPQGIPLGETTFIDNDGNVKESNGTAQQWALRAQLPIDDFEMNLYWVHHFDRTDFRVVQDNISGLFIPTLNEVDHYALSLQYVWDAWIFKSETVYRDFKENINISSFASSITRQDYGLASLATEYLWSHVSGSDTTIILEFQEILGVDDNKRYAINPFQRDLLLGARHSFNDVNAKEVFFSIIADVERGKEILASASYSQRLSDVWKVKVGARYIDAQPPASDPLDPFGATGMRPLNNDHQFDLTFSRYF